VNTEENKPLPFKWGQPQISGCTDLATLKILKRALETQVNLSLPSSPQHRILSIRLIQINSQIAMLEAQERKPNV